MIPQDETEKLKEAAPEVGRIYLAEYIGIEPYELNDIDLVASAIELVDKSKRVKAKRHQHAIKSIGWVLSEIDDSDPKTQALNVWYVKKWLARIVK